MEFLLSYLLFVFCFFLIGTLILFVIEKFLVITFKALKNISTLLQDFQRKRLIKFIKKHLTLSIQNIDHGCMMTPSQNILHLCMRCLKRDGMSYMEITKAIDFLYARMERCKTMAEKEEILELIWDECAKARANGNINELKHARNILQEIQDKYGSS